MVAGSAASARGKAVFARHPRQHRQQYVDHAAIVTVSGASHWQGLPLLQASPAPGAQLFRDGSDAAADPDCLAPTPADSGFAGVQVVRSLSVAEPPSHRS
jgi:hypothetical protein